MSNGMPERERRSRTTSVLKFLTLSMRVSSLSRCSSLWLNAGARVHLRVRMHDWRRPPSEFRTGADEPRYAKRVRQIEQRVDGREHLEILFRRSGGASCGVVVVGPVAPRTCFITRRSYTPSHARVGKKVIVAHSRASVLPVCPKRSSRVFIPDVIPRDHPERSAPQPQGPRTKSLDVRV